jgi:hypothetical protein
VPTRLDFAQNKTAQGQQRAVLKVFLFSYFYIFKVKTNIQKN